MDQKTKTIVIVVVAVAVLGGLYYGYNRWHQQQLANQILKEVYGVNTGLLGKMTGGGNISNQVAQELAKQAAKDEAQQKADEAREAAKTPEDKYNATEEMPTYDDASKAIVSEAKGIIEQVFGKAKLTSLSTNAYGSESAQTSIMDFEISRLATGADLGALSKAFTDKGLPVMQSGISEKTATVVAGDSNTSSYSLSFEIGSQTVGAYVIKISQ